jgi:hypothetical protein
MRSSHQTKFDIAFLDFLFNLLTVFVIIAIIAVIHMNPPTKKSDAPKKAEFIITVEWTKNSNNDIDVWLKTEGKGTPLHFRQKQKAPFFLDRDDTGLNIDTYETSTGEIRKIEINREVVTARGYPEDGDYYVNLHLYNKRSPSIDDEVEVTIVGLNPYRILYQRKLNLNIPWEERDLVSFRIDNEEIHEFHNDHGQFFAQKTLRAIPHSNNNFRGF